MKLLRIIVLVALLPTSSRAGIETKLLAEGKESNFSWSMLQVLSTGEDVDLIVVIQNTGAKWIDTEGIDASFFSLKDSNGKELKIYRATGFTGIAYSGVTVGHLFIDGPISPSAKHEFFLRGKKASIVPASFVAKGVQFAERLKKRSNAEQDGAGQPATRPESNSEGGDKPQPESEGRSR